MNYEQKYNKLVEAVKVLQETNPSDEGIQNWVNENVPELKESGDEKIRKELLHMFDEQRGYVGGNAEWINGIDYDSVVAWLEKQGEQKDNLIDIDAMVLKYSNTREKETNGLPVNCQIRSYRQGINDALNLSLNIEKQGEQKAINDTDEDIVEAVKDTSILDMVEPKFHVGDWIISNKAHEDYRVCKITDIKNGYYAIESIYGYKGYNHFNVFEESYRLWTIKDMKDGDVLVWGDDPDDHHVEIIMLFKSTRNMHSAFTHFHMYVDNYRVNDWCDCCENAHPATKEQRDLLFSKMKEAGYEWDAEKLLITNGGDFESENCEQNPAWSEEDDRTLGYLLAVLEDGIPTDSGKMGKIVDWLRTLKQRYTWKPSVEQMIALRWVLNNITYNKHKEEISGLLDQIKKL